MEVGIVGWLLFIVFGFKHRNTCLCLLNFNFETLKIIKKAIETFPIYQGFCGLVTIDRKIYIVLLSHFIVSCIYIICMLLPSSFHTFHLWITFSLLAVATIVFSGCCRKQVIILLIFRINKTMGSFSPSTWETVAKLLVYFYLEYLMGWFNNKQTPKWWQKNL